VVFPGGQRREPVGLEVGGGTEAEVGAVHVAVRAVTGFVEAGVQGPDGGPVPGPVRDPDGAGYRVPAPPARRS
jgi:hypothetical protein